MFRLYPKSKRGQMMVSEIECWVTVETSVMRAEIPTSINELWHLRLTTDNVPLALLNVAQEDKRAIKYSHIYTTEDE